MVCRMPRCAGGNRDRRRRCGGRGYPAAGRQPHLHVRRAGNFHRARVELRVQESREPEPEAARRGEDGRALPGGIAHRHHRAHFSVPGWGQGREDARSRRLGERHGRQRAVSRLHAHDDQHFQPEISASRERSALRPVDHTKIQGNMTTTNFPRRRRAHTPLVHSSRHTTAGRPQPTSRRVNRLLDDEAPSSPTRRGAEAESHSPCHQVQANLPTRSGSAITGGKSARS